MTVLLARDGSARSILGSVDFAELRGWMKQQNAN